MTEPDAGQAAGRIATVPELEQIRQDAEAELQRIRLLVAASRAMFGSASAQTLADQYRRQSSQDRRTSLQWLIVAGVFTIGGAFGIGWIVVRSQLSSDSLRDIFHWGLSRVLAVTLAVGVLSFSVSNYREARDQHVRNRELALYLDGVFRLVESAEQPETRDKILSEALSILGRGAMARSAPAGDDADLSQKVQKIMLDAVGKRLS